jgi:para-aminobenzoate synthetase / 4-amino-4-deoxychorismate lyase
VPGEFSLLETMRLEEGEVPRLERHLARMAASARHFGFAWDESVVRAALVSRVHAHPAGLWRLRLLVDRGGIPTLECSPHVAPHGLLGTSPRHGMSEPTFVSFARTPVDEHDPFLLHKTTRRAMYDRAHREKPPGVFDAILWNHGDEVTESTIANVVTEIDGVLYTPPIKCGLLGGTLRAELLESGKLRERVITKEEFSAARHIALINSLRGWMWAQLLAV